MLTWRVALVAGLLAAVPAFAQAPAIVARSGDHPGFGRIVFDLPTGVTASATQDGKQASVKLVGAGGINFGPLPHNVLALVPVSGGAEIALAEGVQLRQSRIGGKLVLDFVDPAKPSAQPAAPTPTRTPAAKPTIIVHVPGPDALARQRETIAVAAQPSAPEPVAPPRPILAEAPPAMAEAPAAPPAGKPAEPAVMALVAQPTPPPATTIRAGAGRTITLPFGTNVAAAAFRRGDAAYVVFDERRPIDLMALHDDPVFASAAVTVLPEATVLRVQLAEKDRLRLAPSRDGWSVAVVAADADAAPLLPIASQLEKGRLLLTAEQPGHVVSVPDPLTGGLILVGTQSRIGQGIPLERQAPQFTMLASWQGLAIVPLADAVSLRPLAIGFVLDMDGDRKLALSDATPQGIAETAAQSFSRRYDFPALPIDALRRRAQSAIAAAAAAPVQDRGPRRLEAAQAMLSLGLDAEALALLNLVATDDARLTDDPSRIGLAAIAAMLSGRPAEATGIDDPRLDGTDEISLWRAVRQALVQQGQRQSAATFATNARLALAYPEPLRARLMPLIAETMALGGEAATATVLTKTNLNNNGLDFARALLAAGIPDQQDRALQILDRLSQSSDRSLRNRAALRAIELRLARQALTPAEAADAMDPEIYAWRGDQRELATRLRVAALRSDAGQPRKALALLRETAPIFPDEAAAIQARLAATFKQALADDGAHPLPPLDLIALAEENADLIPAGDAGRDIVLRLCDRLAMLDLPQRAIPLLSKLIESTPIGPARSELGAQLAAMQMETTSPQAALASLADTLAVGTMPADLLERRTLVFARASAAIGQTAQGLAALDALGTLPAVQAQADLAESARDWPAAVSALRHLAAMSIPADGPLTEAHGRLLLRYASAAAQTGHADWLAQIRSRDLPRLPPGQMTDLLKGLTAAPVQTLSDLPRAAQEAREFNGLTKAMQAFTPTATP